MNYLTMRQFGRMGRFANQLFQYAFLKLYAQEHGCQLQVASWVGKSLFGCRDQRITVTLPVFTERRDASNPKDTNKLCPPRGCEVVNHDFIGYGQYHTSYYAPHKDYIRKLFSPADRTWKQVGTVDPKLRRRGKTIVGIHLRRGDYGQRTFYITPVEWYLNTLRQLWPTLDEPVLFVATEDRSLVNQFAEFDPFTTDDLGITLEPELPTYNYLRRDTQVREPWQMDFYPDFYALTCCHYLLIPNSTFSFFAAMLNTRLRACYRSDLPTQRFVRIDPWDVRPMTPDLAEDYRHILGVCLDKNPYWQRDHKVQKGK